MTARALALLGLILCAIALLLITAAPVAALRAWLAAAFLWSGLPFGSLGLMMVMRLTGGRWDQALPPFLEAGALTLPLSFATLLPILLGLPRLYPWTAHPMPGLKGVWLSPLPFILRTLLLYLGTGAALYALTTRRAPSLAVASAGLLFLFPMQTLVLTDWLLSLQPGFHSSGFPLYAMAAQFNLALAVAVLLLLTVQPRQTAALGAILITLTLTWLYLAFTHYIIIWSGNLADLTGWYRQRGQGGWGIAYALVALLETAAFLALLAPAIRRSAKGLRIVAITVLFSRLLEAAWLVLPIGGPPQPLSLLAYMLAAIGLGLLFLPAQAWLLARRVRARLPA